FKQKTAYDMVGSDWSSDVCSSDLSFVGWILAPDADVLINGGGFEPEITGAVTARTLSAVGHVKFHYDENLRPDVLRIITQPTTLPPIAGGVVGLRAQVSSFDTPICQWFDTRFIEPVATVPA